jgi:integrase
MGNESDQLVNLPVANIELADAWRKYYIKEGHTIHSTTTYYNYIKLFVGLGIQINQKAVDKFRDYHYSSASSAALKNFFNFLVVKHNFPPEILYIRFAKNKSTRKFPESLEEIEVKKLIAGMGQHELKSQIMTNIVYELALRISEALKLRFEDFNWATWIMDKNKYGVVNIKYTKRNNFRVMPVKPSIMQDLYNPLVSPNKTNDGIPLGGLLFNFGLENYFSKEKTVEQIQFDYIKYATKRYHKLLRKVGLETINKKVHAHMLRHTKAQSLTNHSMPIESIKGFLGHKAISTTEIYTHSSSEKILADLQKYDQA